MGTFAEALEDIAKRVPETEVLMILGTDGIPIERLIVRADPNMEAVAAPNLMSLNFMTILPPEPGNCWFAGTVNSV